MAWSTPGAALLAGRHRPRRRVRRRGGRLRRSPGVLYLLTGLVRPARRPGGRIPAPLANAMLAGVLLGLCVEPFRALADEPAAIAPVLADLAGAAARGPAVGGAGGLRRGRRGGASVTGSLVDVAGDDLAPHLTWTTPHLDLATVRGHRGPALPGHDDQPEHPRRRRARRRSATAHRCARARLRRRRDGRDRRARRLLDQPGRDLRRARRRPHRPRRPRRGAGWPGSRRASATCCSAARRRWSPPRRGRRPAGVDRRRGRRRPARHLRRGRGLGAGRRATSARPPRDLRGRGVRADDRRASGRRSGRWSPAGVYLLVVSRHGESRTPREGRGSRR